MPTHFHCPEPIRVKVAKVKSHNLLRSLVFDRLTIPVKAFLRGFLLIRLPRFRQYLWRPAACSLVIVSVFLFLAFSYIKTATHSIMQLLPDWLSFSGAILVPMVYVIVIVSCSWLVGFVAIIISSPFLGSLSSQTEEHEYGAAIIADESLIRSAVSAYKRELTKLRYHLTVLLAALIIGLILSPIAPLIWLIVGAWLTAVQFVDHASENRGLPFSHTRTLLRQNPGPTIVFGSLAVGLLALPFFNILVIPASVCAGTILWNVLHESPAKHPPTATNRQ